MAAQQPSIVIDIRRVHRILSTFVRDPEKFCTATLPAHNAYVARTLVGQMLAGDHEPRGCKMVLCVPSSESTSLVDALVAEDGYVSHQMDPNPYRSSGVVVGSSSLVRRRHPGGEVSESVTVCALSTSSCMLFAVDSFARTADRTCARGYFDGSSVYHMHPEITAMRMDVFMGQASAVACDGPFHRRTDDHAAGWTLCWSNSNGDVGTCAELHAFKEITNTTAATKIACTAPGPPPFAGELVEVACRPPCNPCACTCDHIRVFCSMGGVLYREAVARHSQ